VRQSATSPAAIVTDESCACARLERLDARTDEEEAEAAAAAAGGGEGDGDNSSTLFEDVSPSNRSCAERLRARLR
jgi:hypothetical protein